MVTTKMLGSAGQQYAINGNLYTADANGLITNVAMSDIVGLINEGAVPTTIKARHYNLGAVAAALATAVVASAALSNGTLTVAGQPDISRPVQFVINPGVSAITAGLLTIVYNDSQGQAVTEALSLATALSTAKTLTSSHGVSSLTSAIVTGLVGGTSPNIQGGTNPNVALPVDGGAVAITVFKATADSANDTLPTAPAGSVDARVITPHTVPNGTHALSFGVNFYGL
jgi:hypothetical protein